MIAFLFFICTINCHCPPDHIEECIKPKPIGDRPNTNGMYYHEGTFGVNFASDPCEPTSDKSNTGFRNMVKRTFRCTGKHCVDGEFKCKVGDNKDCYNVEHIFDKGGCEYNKTDKNIVGNLVMAWGKWNQEVSHSRIGCSTAMEEKTKTYGSVMITKVRNMIELCRNRKKKTKRVEFDTNQNDSMIIDESYDEQINEFNYSECDKSCTCDSNKYLDVLCGCDYSETDFDLKSCPTPVSTGEHYYRDALIFSTIFLSLCTITLIAALYVIISDKNKKLDVQEALDKSLDEDL